MSIAITGNPGVGKHSISDKIAQKFNLNVIDINKIAKDSGLFEVNQNTNDVDTEKLKKVLKEKISKNSLIIGHLAPYVLEKNQVEKIIILRRNPYELLDVYKQRKYNDKKSKENTGSEILGIITHDTIREFQEKAFQIDTSEKSIQEVTEKAINVISGDTQTEEVDWLDLVTKNNDFKKFFDD
ncbi:MAG: AAA family ATPase [Nitrosopumilus sp.]|uniref:adenylate kinase family protein n=1 Tax=Nitrosopumilus sp. TaxID=2024843 RepID=UPI00247C0FAD|nr:AAA family ATPase [Nitrosopumilus sp.]MCV0392924.1 AAA family ATPase [Nitrosopumilus sp.]